MIEVLVYALLILEAIIVGSTVAFWALRLAGVKPRQHVPQPRVHDVAITPAPVQPTPDDLDRLLALVIAQEEALKLDRGVPHPVAPRIPRQGAPEPGAWWYCTERVGCPAHQSLTTRGGCDGYCCTACPNKEDTPA